MILFETSERQTVALIYDRGAFGEYLEIDLGRTTERVPMTPWQLLCFGFKCISAAIWP